jgi:hypothetical protein
VGRHFLLDQRCRCHHALPPSSHRSLRDALRQVRKRNLVRMEVVEASFLPPLPFPSSPSLPSIALHPLLLATHLPTCLSLLCLWPCSCLSVRSHLVFSPFAFRSLALFETLVTFIRRHVCNICLQYMPFTTRFMLCSLQSIDFSADGSGSAVLAGCTDQPGVQLKEEMEMEGKSCLLRSL